MNIVFGIDLIHSDSSPISLKFFPIASPNHGYFLFLSVMFLSLTNVFSNSGKQSVSKPSNTLRINPK